MAEKTLNDPLSGAEIKQIISTRIKEAMTRDCTLVDDLSYPGFRVEFDIKITYNRSPTPGTQVWGTKQEGVIEPKSPFCVVKDKYAEDSPNRARIEHDMPVPVEVQTPNGPQKRMARIAKEEK